MDEPTNSGRASTGESMPSSGRTSGVGKAFWAGPEHLWGTGYRRKSSSNGETEPQAGDADAKAQAPEADAQSSAPDGSQALSLEDQARLWLKRRKLGLPADPPEQLPLELQELAFDQIDPEMLELEARQYLRRLKAHQHWIADMVERDIWICGDETFSRERICGRLRTAILLIELHLK